MGERTPGVVGLDPFENDPGTGEENPTRRGGFIDQGPGGIDAPIPLADRIITVVEDDWHPPSPDETPTVELTGKTLAEVVAQLNRMNEWGKGGGSLRNESVPVGTSASVIVKLKGNLVRRMPHWKNYDSASEKAQRAWNHMFRKLMDHEQRHMDIAVEQGDALAAELVGKEIGKLADLVTKYNGKMATAQQKLDADTDNGSRPNVEYGGVELDGTIT